MAAYARVDGPPAAEPAGPAQRAGPAEPAGPAASAIDPLTGRTFLSVEITEAGKPKALLSGTRVRLTFPEPGRMAVSASCNHLGTPVRSASGRLDVGLTMRARTGPGGTPEPAVLAVLEGTVRYRIEAGYLTLNAPSGAGLRLAPQS